MSEDNTKAIDRLNAIINNPKNSQKAIDSAKTQLARLEAEGNVQVMNQQAGVSVDPNVQAILDGLNKALNKGYTNTADIRKEIEEVLKFRKITEGDLSDSLRALISSTRKLELTITQINGNVSRTTTQDSFLKLDLTQNLLSDMKARNNSYLYGGAGTGKTYSAEEIASLLGWELITINCSQYTSPLDILGGQTIEGYQEGRLSQAWSNIIMDSSGRAKPVDGVVLLLDELPKIDPNTAGLLNDALAKVKPNKTDPTTNTAIMPKIRNGRGDEITLKNMYVIATGNVPLNTIDPDYEANFKQDLSLQDRFVGATYKVKVNYEYELENIMSGYAFIWLFLSKVKLAIKKVNGGSQAFVSLRIMINAKETYRVYRDVMDDMKSNKVDMITSPKTLIQTMDSFFDLFKPAQAIAIIKEVDYENFKQVLKEKEKMPYIHSRNKQMNDFNTPTEMSEAQNLIVRLNSEL
jgi:cobaltochelatase CobS